MSFAAEMLGLSTEAIDYQGSKFFDALTEVFAKIDTATKNKAGFAKIAAKFDKDIASLVKEYVGFDNITIKWGENFYTGSSVHKNYLMATQCVQIDANHPFRRSFGPNLDKYIDEWIKENREGVLKKQVEDELSHIDVRNGKIRGPLAKAPIEFNIGEGYFHSTDFTMGNVAAFSLHEISHSVSYFDLLGNTALTSVLLAGASSRFFHTDNVDERRVILREYAESVGVPVQKIDVTEVKDRVAFQTVLLSTTFEHRRSTTGSRVYDQRSWEQISDDYAIRNGAGRDLAIGMDKLNKLDDTNWNKAFVIDTMVMVVGAITAVATPVGWITLGLGAISFAICASINDPDDKIYDDPKQRFANMRKTLNDVLKNHNLDKVIVANILEQLDTVRAIEKKYDDSPNLFEKMWLLLGPGRRSSADRVKLMKEIEELANNDLFAAAHKLNQGV